MEWLVVQATDENRAAEENTGSTMRLNTASPRHIHSTLLARPSFQNTTSHSNPSALVFRPCAIFPAPALLRSFTTIDDLSEPVNGVLCALHLASASRYSSVKTRRQHHDSAIPLPLPRSKRSRKTSMADAGQSSITVAGTKCIPNSQVARLQCLSPCTAIHDPRSSANVRRTS